MGPTDGAVRPLQCLWWAASFLQPKLHTCLYPDPLTANLKKILSDEGKFTSFCIIHLTFVIVCLLYVSKGLHGCIQERNAHKNTQIITHTDVTATAYLTQPRLLHAKSRPFVLKTISSPGRKAIEQHYRHYRRFSLEIGFTSIPWLITICRQQQSGGGG